MPSAIDTMTAPARKFLCMLMPLLGMGRIVALYCGLVQGGLSRVCARSTAGGRCKEHCRGSVRGALPQVGAMGTAGGRCNGHCRGSVQGALPQVGASEHTESRCDA